MTTSDIAQLSLIFSVEIRWGRNYNFIACVSSFIIPIFTTHLSHTPPLTSFYYLKTFRETIGSTATSISKQLSSTTFLEKKILPTTTHKSSSLSGINPVLFLPSTVHHFSSLINNGVGKIISLTFCMKYCEVSLIVTSTLCILSCESVYLNFVLSVLEWYNLHWIQFEMFCTSLKVFARVCCVY